MLKIKIENKSAVTLHGLGPGKQREIEVDVNGTPVDRNWRRRLSDASMDGAIVKVETKKIDEKGD